MNNYETVFIVTPVLSEQQVAEVADKFQGIITENGGQIVNVENWGLKKLAYSIQKKTTGFYFLVEFACLSVLCHSLLLLVFVSKLCTTLLRVLDSVLVLLES